MVPYSPLPHKVTIEGKANPSIAQAAGLRFLGLTTDSPEIFGYLLKLEIAHYRNSRDVVQSQTTSILSVATSTTTAAKSLIYIMIGSTVAQALGSTSVYAAIGKNAA
ncbi:hypothetical protein Tco_0763437 [Tanacetum coccineum]